MWCMCVQGEKEAPVKNSCLSSLLRVSIKAVSKMKAGFISLLQKEELIGQLRVRTVSVCPGH